MALSSAGYTVRQIQELQKAVGAQPQARPAHKPHIPLSSVPKPAPVQINQPTVAARASRVEMSAPVQVNAISSTQAPTDIVKTKYGSDKDLFFLFSQLGSYFRSGINPAQALGDLSRRTPPRYQQSLLEAAAKVGEGGRMSDVFERYAYLYPPDVIGTIRAGEVAGFLPEAMDEISNKMHLSHQLKKKLRYYSWSFVITVVITPLILATVQGSLKSMEIQDQAGGNLSPTGTLGKAVGSSVWHDLPITLLLFGALVGGYMWLNSMRMRDFRHKMIIRLPVIGNRAMAESMSRMSWAMSMVSRGGLSPQNTFLLAAESVPNLYVRQRLTEEGSVMKESDKLSAAIRRTNLLPPEYGNIVETGEVTGDVHRALEHVARATEGDFQTRDATAAVRTNWILFGLLAVIITILAGWLLTRFYGGLIGTLTIDPTEITAPL